MPGVLILIMAAAIWVAYMAAITAADMVDA